MIEFLMLFGTWGLVAGFVLFGVWLWLLWMAKKEAMARSDDLRLELMEREAFGDWED